ncbi:MAG: leucine-rich repeat protein, partial [Clostridia bacterium]|nr:leucine-rich repeat protein [Clostridia bacterium]
MSKTKFLKKNFLNVSRGITLISLIVTIVIMTTLAGVGIKSLTGSKGLINQAKTTKTAAEMKELEEQIEVELIRAEMRKDVTMEIIIQELIEKNLIDNESQVDKETGTITIGEYEMEEKLAHYVITPGEKYYGNKNIVPTDSKYFSFSVNKDGQTATISGVKDSYAVKTSYKGSATKYTAVIKDGTTYVKDVVIPYEYVDSSGNKYTVTEIGNSAFGLKDSSSWDSEISNVENTFTSFTLPNTITTIGNSAFRGTTTLTKINIPNSVTSIGSYAFAECMGLPNAINISNATTIGGGAFQKCTTLSAVKLGEGLKNIQNTCFSECTNLNNINIPDGVTTIGISSFSHCTSLKKITLPDGLTSIGYGSFAYCSNLNVINIPNTVTAIEQLAFRECINLKDIKIPGSVKNIGAQSFQDCTGLINVTIEEGVTTIVGTAFGRMYKFKHNKYT